MVLCCLPVARLAAAPGRLAPAQLDGQVLETAKHAFTIAPSGLPGQVVIKADTPELPHDLRNVEPGDAQLRELGRGTQLRGEARLEATVGGETTTLEPVAPAAVTAADGGARAEAKLAAAGVQADLVARYGPDGSMQFTVTYKAAAIERLELVFELAGPFDTLVEGRPVDGRVRAYDPLTAVLAGGEGTVWEGPGEGDGSSGGIAQHVFLGNGDRGFTWLAEPGDGWIAAKGTPMMVVERDEAGLVTWRVRLVSEKATVRKPRVAAFAVLVHPASVKEPASRRAGWLAWPHGQAVGQVLPLAFGARPGQPTLLRADCATVHEALALGSVVSGAAGGDALARDTDLADTYPITLFRYLAGTHTGLGVRLQSNAAVLSRPGMSPATDRMTIGRALLHDIGLDVSRLAHRVEAAAIVRALHEFGFFTDDGQTEYLPYWRSEKVARYGEAFAEEDAFAVEREDPMARVHVSAFVRPGRRNRFGKDTRQAMLVIVNESPQPVRQQLYVFDPGRLFGGANRVFGHDVIGGWDMHGIPEESDWRRSAMQKSIAPKLQHGQKEAVHLLDVTDGGYAIRATAKEGMEIYGPVFVPAHDIRVLYGAGAQYKRP